jgi:zinc and cadmium transporter
MSPLMLLVVYCLLILLASLAGGWLPLMIRLTHRRMQLAVSLVAGVMLGVGLLHMLPHALLEAPDRSDRVFICVLVGFLAMFFIERFFCFHHHDVPAAELDEGHAAEHAHHHPHEEVACEGVDSHAHRLSWTGAAIGLTLHTIIAGIALAASVAAATRGGHLAALAGFGTFLVIFLHKPFDAMTITTLMAVGAWPRAAMHCVNGLFALMIPVGVILFHLGLSQLGGGSNLVAYALAFSAGTFLCVSMSDLLPELQFHAHDRVALSATLILGLAIAWVIGLAEEQGHAHEHEHPASVEANEHAPGHAGHEH